MNIRCPQCQTVFRVNPERIPPQGVRARCARCGGTFTVQLPSSAARGGGAASPPAATGTRPASTGGEGPGRSSAGTHGAAVGTESGNTTSPAVGAPGPTRPAPRHAGPGASPPASEPDHGAASRPDAAPWPGTTDTAEHSDRPVFGSRDPKARAARLARALVSDIVAYHPERRDESLAQGTMRTAFREEIMKSWEEYVAQVGNDLAKSTPYFRDALNEILAKGQKIF